MFGIFKKRNQKEILQAKYDKLMEEAFRLSTTNRKMSDAKTYEADMIMDELEKLN